MSATNFSKLSIYHLWITSTRSFKRLAFTTCPSFLHTNWSGFAWVGYNSTWFIFFSACLFHRDGSLIIIFADIFLKLQDRLQLTHHTHISHLETDIYQLVHSIDQTMHDKARKTKHCIITNNSTSRSRKKWIQFTP